jgi:pyruvate-ferredoxin/flavodoxin oxidoreductase
VEKALRKYFGKRGDRVVQDNLTCVKRGYSEMKEIPPAIIYGQSHSPVAGEAIA